MATRRLHALAVALAAASTMAAPAPQPASPVAATVTAQPGQRAVEQASMTPPAARTVSSNAVQLMPMVNVPFTRRREAIWLGRPRDRMTGRPRGSWR